MKTRKIMLLFTRSVSFFLFLQLIIITGFYSVGFADPPTADFIPTTTQDPLLVVYYDMSKPY